MASFVVAVGNDDDANLAVVTARELGADRGIVARVINSDSASKLRRAGANYALSLPDISTRLIALNVLRDTSGMRATTAHSFTGEALPDSLIEENPGDTEQDEAEDFIRRLGYQTRRHQPRADLTAQENSDCAADPEVPDRLRRSQFRLSCPSLPRGRARLAVFRRYDRDCVVDIPRLEFLLWEGVGNL